MEMPKLRLNSTEAIDSLMLNCFRASPVSERAELEPSERIVAPIRVILDQVDQEQRLAAVARAN